MPPWERYGQQAAGPWAKYGAPQSEEPNAVVDAVKSGAAGLAEGAIGLASGGDIRNLASKATEFVGGKLGLSPETVNTVKDVGYNLAKSNPITAPIALGPTSAELQQKVEERTGKFHEPQTTAGKYARTVGQFAPGAIAGPGGFARRVVTQAILPGIASEAAGQATEGSAAEPYARAGAALLTSVLGTPRAAPARVTADDLRGAARQGYNDPAVTGLVLDPAAIARVGARNERAMEAGGARRSFAGPAFTVNEELGQLPNTQVGRAMQAAGLNPGATIDDIKSVRTALGKVVEQGTDALTGRQNPTAGAAQASRRGINDYLTNIPAQDVRSGNAQAASTALRRADADYSASMRARTVEALMRRAELQAGSANSGQNINNATRQKLRSLLANEKKTAGYSDAEMRQLERAVLGTRTGNAARFLGNAFGPSGALMALPGAGVAGGAYAMGVDPSDAAAIGVLSSLAGRGARRIGNASTARQVERFQDMVAQSAPSYQRLHGINTANAARITADDRRLALVRALMLSQQPSRQPVAAQ